MYVLPDIQMFYPKSDVPDPNIEFTEHTAAATKITIFTASVNISNSATHRGIKLLVLTPSSSQSSHPRRYARIIAVLLR